MDREELWVEVNENTRTNNSFNARIAVAMAGVSDKGLSNKTMICSWDAKDLRPIPDSEYYRNGLRPVEKRPRRKWVLRKLRRPAWLFVSSLFLLLSFHWIRRVLYYRPFELFLLKNFDKNWVRIVRNCSLVC